jgi:hypothetical protein
LSRYWLLGLAATFVFACALSGGSAIVLLRLRLRTLVRDTYQSHPYGSE